MQPLEVTVKSQPIGQTCAVTNGSGTGTASADVGSVAIVCRGYMAYVTNIGSSNVATFAVNAGNGALSAASGGTLTTSYPPTAIAVSDDGLHAYAAHQDDKGVLAYTVGSGGLLTLLESTSGISESRGLAMRPGSANVHNRSDATVSPHIISGGGLTLVSTGAVAAGSFPAGVAVSPDSKYACVTNAGAATVSQYAVDTACGLTPIATMASGGSSPSGIAVR